MARGVLFNDVEEFLEELRADTTPPLPIEGPDPTNVERKILRLTNQLTTTNSFPIRNLSIVAAYRLQSGEVVRLERFVGQVLQSRGAGPNADEAVYGQAEGIRNVIEKTATERGLEVRAGKMEG